MSPQAMAAMKPADMARHIAAMDRKLVRLQTGRSPHCTFITQPTFLI